MHVIFKRGNGRPKEERTSLDKQNIQTNARKGAAQDGDAR